MSGMNSRTGVIPGRHWRLGVSGYALNDDDQRTRTTLADGSIWNYGYDGKNQLVTATRGSQNAMAYAYDGIGNRTAATEDGAETTYTANLLNQYTAINAEAPTYDADGNMQTNAGWTYTWNNDSRLVKAEKESARLEFSYDYMGRRMFKKVYASNTLVKHEKYVYDGYKLVAIYDGLNSDALLKTFIWQPISLDVPLCMTAGGVTYYYLTDGNKNVIGLYDSTGIQVAAYTYGPFGQLLSSTGTAAMENSFRFSSEFHDDETGLVYYNYRYYCPKLGRWTKRDPNKESSDHNYYAMVRNNVCNLNDKLGLRTVRNATEVFSLGKRRLKGKYSDYTITIDTAYIDASTRENLGDTLGTIRNALPNSISNFKGGKIGSPGYLGSGFIARVERWNREICTRWVQYIWRENRFEHSGGPFLELDYAFPAKHATAVDFPGDVYSSVRSWPLYQKFELRLMDLTNNEVMHTIYWSNEVIVTPTESLTPTVAVSLSITW